MTAENMTFENIPSNSFSIPKFYRPATKHQRNREKRECIYTSSAIADDDELEARVIHTLLSRNGL
jgi:hypothetical protein